MVVVMNDPRTDQIAKLKQTIAMLEEQQRTLGADLSLSINQTRELLAKLEQAEPAEAPLSWGVQLNRHDTFTRKRRGTPPEGCPTWARPSQIEDRDKHGLIVWNHETRQLHRFWAEQALGFLEKLRAGSGWRTTGITLTQTVSRQIAHAAPQPKRTGRKKGTRIESPATQEAKPKYEEFEEECVKLPVSAGDDFFAFLVSHEVTLREMAAEDEKERSRILGEVYEIILQAGAKHKATEIDLTARPLSWVRGEGGLKFVCDRSPNRATVAYNGKTWAWQASIEQPHRFKHESTWIHEPEEALAWAEKELLLAEQEQAAPAKEDDEPLPASTVDLTPFWIAPAVLEPEQITYRVVIFIEREPTEFKTMEMSFGEQMRYDEEYPGPQALARELEIDSTQMTVKQIVPEFGLYRAKSNVTYFKESVAAAQAQSTWDRGKIVKAFQEGKIISAYYGYEEAETGYEIYLGSCQKPEAVNYTPGSRAEYLVDRAMRYTLLNALDVDGFRAYLGITREFVGDEDLLVRMHEERAKLPYIPQAAQAESQKWLNENAQLVRQNTRQKSSRR
jgi:hypothetical protein